MSDLINRHGVVAWLDNMGYPKLADIVNDKKRFPSAEPERKIGKWIHYEDTLTCSECQFEIYDYIMDDFDGNVPKFCPECGADMRENHRPEYLTQWLGEPYQEGVNK